MTQEKKKSLQILLMGTSAIVVMWILWLVMILWSPNSREFGLTVLLALPIAAATLVGISAAIADIKILLRRDDDKKG